MFKLEFKISPFFDKINIKKSSIFTIGSCFSESMGDYFIANKFKTLKNPCGTLYNPISIFKILRNDIDLKNIIEKDNLYFHWDMHSQIYSTSENELVSKIKKINIKIKKSLAEIDWILITFGSSLVYRQKANNHIVANCHKLDHDLFIKSQLTVNEILNDFDLTYQILKKLNPKIKFILTVSPVRHLKDGLIENTLSKAVLHQAINHILTGYKQIYYFPSYEIMIDELRDYRFYTNDYIHPSKDAIEYIWNRFNETVFDVETKKLIKEWMSIKSALNHTPLHKESDSYKKFITNTLNKLYSLKKDLSVENEIDHFNKILSIVNKNECTKTQ